MMFPEQKENRPQSHTSDLRHPLLFPFLPLKDPHGGTGGTGRTRTAYEEGP